MNHKPKPLSSRMLQISNPIGPTIPTVKAIMEGPGHHSWEIYQLNNQPTEP